MTSRYLIATDMDGTLMTSDNELHPRTSAALQAARQAGHVVAIATGRPVEIIGDPAEHVDWVVAGNGAVVIEQATGEIKFEITFSMESAFEVMRSIRAAVPSVGYQLTTDVGTWHEAGFEKCVRFIDPKSEIADIFSTPGRVARQLAAFDCNKSVDELTQAITPALTDGFIAEWSGIQAVKVGPVGVDKAITLAWLADHLDIAVTDVVAFGDYDNDHQMLQWAGHGVAMANADDTTKSFANEITLSNDDHGVAVVIERLLRN